MEKYKSPFTNLAAAGNGEIYDISGADKFLEFGWRCSTHETGYRTQTLIGNWNEERFDVKYLTKEKPIPSQYSHYFETTHKKCFGAGKKIENFPIHVKFLRGKPCEPRTFPSHQPELDPEKYKHHYNRFETTSMVAYKDPTKK